MIILSSIIIRKGKKIKKKLYIKYNVYLDITMLVIHVWYAWPTCWLSHKSHMANSIIFKF